MIELLKFSVEVYSIIACIFLILTLIKHKIL